MKRISLLILVAVLPCVVLFAQIDTLKPGQPLKNFKYLKPSVSRCTLFSEKGGKYTPTDIVWTRRLEFAKENGEDVVVVRQQMDCRDLFQSSTKVSILKTN